MTTFAKIRELKTLSRDLKREARRMAPGTGRDDRMRTADEYDARCLMLAGRVSREDYWAWLASR